MFCNTNPTSSCNQFSPHKHTGNIFKKLDNCFGTSQDYTQTLRHRNSSYVLWFSSLIMVNMLSTDMPVDVQNLINKTIMRLRTVTTDVLALHHTSKCTHSFTQFVDDRLNWPWKWTLDWRLIDCNGRVADGYCFLLAFEIDWYCLWIDWTFGRRRYVTTLLDMVTIILRMYGRTLTKRHMHSTYVTGSNIMRRERSSWTSAKSAKVKSHMFQTRFILLICSNQLTVHWTVNKVIVLTGNFLPSQKTVSATCPVSMKWNSGTVFRRAIQWL